VRACAANGCVAALTAHIYTYGCAMPAPEPSLSCPSFPLVIIYGQPIRLALAAARLASFRASVPESFASLAEGSFTCICTCRK